jgi:hypothetical protein
MLSSEYGPPVALQHDPAIDSVQPDTGRLDFACPAFPGSLGIPSVPTPRLEVGFVIPLAFCDGRAAPVSQELGEKTPSKHEGILVGADRGALQDDRGGARHRAKPGLNPPQPLASGARSSCGVSRPACHTWKLLSKAQGGAWMAGTRRSSERRRPECIPCRKYEQMVSFCGKRVRQKAHPEVRFGQEVCPKCATLDKILVHIQSLDLRKGPLENVLSFPNLKFSFDENNPHRWRCSQAFSDYDKIDDPE